MMKKRASIDIGSNSILLLAVEIENDNFKTILNESHVTGLGRDLDLNKSFIQVAMDESYAILKKYKLTCESIGIDSSDIITTATEASRVATNAKDFFLKVEKELNIKVQVISGEGEAYYSTRGILFDSKIREDLVTIMDIGGASTEIIQVERESSKIIRSFSMPIGAVRVNSWIHDNTLKEKINEVLGSFQDDLSKVKTSKLHCVAGTMTSVGNMYLNNENFIENEVNGLEIKVSDIDKMALKYKKHSADQLREIYPFLGKRAVTINAGIVVAQTVFKELGVLDVFISTYGLRYGTILEGYIKDTYVWK